MTDNSNNCDIQEKQEEKNDSASQEKKPVLQREIRIDLIFLSIIRNWRKYIAPMSLTIVLTAIIVFSIPRYYSVTVMLAPESSSGSPSMSGIGSLASMAGINLSSLNSEDAIVPLFYPDLMKSTDFIVPLLDTKVQTLDGKFKGSYLDYLTTQSKVAWWEKEIAALKKTMGLDKTEKIEKGKNGKVIIDPFKLNWTQTQLVKGVSGNINCSVDKKTDVITMKVTAQDPLVAALMADTVKANLQRFITNYRTQKAKNDLRHYQELMEKAHRDYEVIQKKYASYVDANQDVVLASFKMKETNLENELQLAYNTYSQQKVQVQMAEAKVTERTPAFTTLQNASVPVKPAGPKRMITMLVMMVLCFIGTSIYIVAKDPSLRY